MGKLGWFMLDINLNIPTTWRWAHGDMRARERERERGVSEEWSVSEPWLEQFSAVNAYFIRLLRLRHLFLLIKKFPPRFSGHRVSSGHGCRSLFHVTTVYWRELYNLCRDSISLWEAVGATAAVCFVTVVNLTLRTGVIGSPLHSSQCHACAVRSVFVYLIGDLNRNRFVLWARWAKWSGWAVKFAVLITSSWFSDGASSSPVRAVAKFLKRLEQTCATRLLMTWDRFLRCREFTLFRLGALWSSFGVLCVRLVRVNKALLQSLVSLCVVVLAIGHRGCASTG